MADGAASGTAGRPRVALVRQGDVPRVNAMLGGLLAGAFPEVAVDDLDVLRIARRSGPAWGATVVAGLAEHSVRLLRGRIDRKKAVITSSAFAAAARTVVADRVRPGTHAFVFQSQSLFPAVVPGVPHFVYTDHAHLANLRYPGFDVRRLASAAYLRRELELYRAATVVFTRSEHVRSTLVHAYGCDPARVVCVGVGPNTPPRPPVAVRPWNGGRIVFVGVDWDRKGGPLLLAAFRSVRAQHPSARLDVVGCDPQVDEPGVTVHGRVPVERVRDILETSDVFCLPTRLEPFGVAFIEAMHVGLPVVGPELGAVPDFVLPGRTGLLVQPDHVGDLHEALTFMVEHPEMARAMGQAAQALARGKYDWDVVMGEIRRHVLRHVDLPVAPLTQEGATT